VQDLQQEDTARLRGGHISENFGGKKDHRAGGNANHRRGGPCGAAGGLQGIHRREQYIANPEHHGKTTRMWGVIEKEGNQTNARDRVCGVFGGGG